MPTFPDAFVWGVSTSAYQIEGAADAPGKGPSIWDEFSHTPGRIRDGTTGDRATDHLARMEEDLDLLAELGVGAYRFSVAWTRLFPEGRGRPRRDGLAPYERLVDGLLARGIEPWACLYHWDLPQDLQARGGWHERDTALYFADYAAAVAERLGDRVPVLWMLNEPNVHAALGHLLGVHAPGLSDPGAFAAAIHHQNLATALGIERLREIGGAWRLGTIVNVRPARPASDSEDDRAAASFYDAVYHRSVLDPLLTGAYPDAVRPLLTPWLRAGDETRLHQVPDLLGVNYYTRVRVRASDTSLVGFDPVPPARGVERTAMGDAVDPDGLHDALCALSRGYPGVPLVVTESGAAFDDPPAVAGRIDDARRVAYLRRHVRAVHAAIEDGCDVRGYFVWTLVDNFEWAEGFTRPFGLVGLDLDTLARRPKRSFAAYRDIVRDRGLPDDTAAPGKGRDPG